MLRLCGRPFTLCNLRLSRTNTFSGQFRIQHESAPAIKLRVDYTSNSALPRLSTARDSYTMSATVKENIPAPVAKADNVLSLRSASGGLDTDLTAAAVRQCTQSLTDDKVIAVPTDTIYGLATRAQSSLAVKKLYDIKGRNFFKPIAICVASVLDVQKYGDVSELPPGLLEKLLPGPVTVILRRTTTLNPDLNPYTNVVGIRVPDNDFVLQLMKSCDSEFGPLALTSANMAGEESAVCVTDFEKLWPKISSVVDGGKVGVAKTGSTIVDLSVRGRYRIVRDGSALQETTQTLEAHALTQIDGAESKLNAARAYEVALLDIEGTTTPITFVHDVLFPYAKDNVERYLKANWTTADCQDVVQQLRVLATTDAESGIEGAVTIPPTPTDTTDEKNAELSEAETSCIECVVKSVRWLMSADRKVGPLKLLQGRIWTDAYATGEIKGAVYDDVVPVLAEWKANGVDAYIYSSGSIAAQKLLFQYSEKGDILPYFSGHFDTTIGTKLEPSSYTTIAKEIGVSSPARIMFCTDNIAEAEAARNAGMTAVVLMRPGNADIAPERLKHFLYVPNFTSLPSVNVAPSGAVSPVVVSGEPQHPCKRPKLD